MYSRLKLSSAFLLALLSTVYAGPNANPAMSAPGPRATIGVGYEAGGYTITNDSISMLMNRVMVSAAYAPTSIFNFGIDAGAAQIEVDSATLINASSGALDTFLVFHGNWGLSAGAHVKLATPPLFGSTLSLVALGRGTFFSSVNKYNAIYGGYDATGIVGLQAHIPGFGYVSVGPQAYLIQGINKSADGQSGNYSNLNNVRGWLAIDFFPKMTGTSNNQKPYLSAEVSIAPAANFSKRVPFNEITFAISLGTVTGKLFGEETDVPWEP